MTDLKARALNRNRGMANAVVSTAETDTSSYAPVHGVGAPLTTTTTQPPPTYYTPSSGPVAGMGPQFPSKGVSGASGVQGMYSPPALTMVEKLTMSEKNVGGRELHSY